MRQIGVLDRDVVICHVNADYSEVWPCWTLSVTFLAPREGSCIASKGKVVTIVLGLAVCL